MNNNLKLRLANIAFKVLKIAKRWKTQDEVYTVQQWQKYCDKLQKRPKFTPIVVPAKVKEKAEILRDKLVEEGKSMEEAKSVVQNKYSKKSVEEISEMTDKIFNKKKELKRKQQEKEKRNSPEEKAKRKEERRIKDIERKQKEREDHSKKYNEMKKLNAFSYGIKKYKKMDCEFDNEEGEEIFEEIFGGRDKSGNLLLSKGNREQLMNQICKFHRDRPLRKRKRTDMQLVQDFISHMKPDGYSSIKEFDRAKKRLMDFAIKHGAEQCMAMIHSVISNDDEEEVVIKDKKTKSTKKSKSKKSPAKQQPAIDNRPAGDITKEYLNNL